MDRDGVVNVDFGYVHSKEAFKLVDGFVEGAQFLIEQNYHLVIVTNQSGISRSFYTEETFVTFSDWIYLHLKKLEITLAATYFCPHHPHFSGSCDCRKPQAGLITQALNDFQVSPENCLLIGDKMSDIDAGLSARVGRLHKIADCRCSGLTKKYSVGDWRYFIELERQRQKGTDRREK